MGVMMALAALDVLTAGVKVRCQAVERDRHGRIVAKVFAPDGADISRRLVSAGWALAYRRYSMDYVDAEDEARKARRGCGGAPSSNPGCGAHRHRRGARRHPFWLPAAARSGPLKFHGTNPLRGRRCTRGAGSAGGGGDQLNGLG
jgi:hypothetical protein